MNENIYRLLAIGIFLVGATISVYFRSRAERRSQNEKVPLDREGAALMIVLRLCGLSLWLAVLTYMLNPKWIAWSQLSLPAWLRLSGALAGAAADALSYWVFRSLGDNVTLTVRVRAQHNLVTSGPYRWVRHPLYTVGFLSYISFAVLAANWFVAILSVLTLGLIAARIPAEETEHILKNGQAYREYSSRTGRFLPRIG